MSLDRANRPRGCLLLVKLRQFPVPWLPEAAGERLVVGANENPWRAGAAMGAGPEILPLTAAS